MTSKFSYSLRIKTTTQCTYSEFTEIDAIKAFASVQSPFYSS